LRQKWCAGNESSCERIAEIYHTQKKSSNNVEEIVDVATKFQWEVIKTLATKAQEVEDKDKGKVIEVEDDDWGDDELLFDFDSE
jgi:tRNA A37 threonylcarbamoyltransferase TsaD